MLRNITQHYFFFARKKTIYKNKKINKKYEILKII